MFTGLVWERGQLTAPPEPSGQGGVRLVIGHSSELGERLAIGASLAVDGVCLTLIEHRSQSAVVELGPETLARTTLGERRDGDRVNLEPALAVGDALGGHWVQGHVDGVLEVVDRRDLEAHRELAFALPDAYRAWVVEKGSVTLDGVSLTVATVAEDRFTVALIPHTLEVTTLGRLTIGSKVHYEADILAKYVARALAVNQAERG
ncbi:MAG: riboflavin synthase [Acidobacteriota bacterium]